MPARTFYRDPTTGRFISRAAAEELEEAILYTGSSGIFTSTPVSFGEPIEDDDVLSVDPYTIEDSKWGGRIIIGDEEDWEERLEATEFPEWATGYRVTYDVGVSTRYAKGYASTGRLGRGQWPPSLDMLEGVEPDGIAHIVFRRASDGA